MDESKNAALLAEIRACRTDPEIAEAWESVELAARRYLKSYRAHIGIKPGDRAGAEEKERLDRLRSRAHESFIGNYRSFLRIWLERTGTPCPLGLLFDPKDRVAVRQLGFAIEEQD